MQFRIKSDSEMKKPMGKTLRLLEELQFTTINRVVPSDDPKFFVLTHPKTTCADSNAPPLESTTEYLKGRIINKGCVRWKEEALLGWYFEIEHNGFFYVAPQKIVELREPYGIDLSLTARNYYESIPFKNASARLWTEMLIDVYEREMRRSSNGEWNTDSLIQEYIELYELKKKLLTI